MKKSFFIFLMLLVASSASFAQKKDSVKKKPLKYNQYVSFQVNGLLHELTNFGGTPATNNLNPYLVNYFVNNNKTGWGFRTGAGYSNGSNENITLYGNSSSSSTYFNFRVGFEKARHLSKYLTTGLGFDFLYSYSITNTSSGNNSPYTYDTSSSTTKNVTNTFGCGFMGWLRCRITKRVFIGTEASFYYSAGNRTQSLSYAGYLGGSANYSNYSNSKNESISSTYFTEPVVVYLLIRI